MLKALVIGCGAIGAGYDLHTDAVQTHAKAFFLHPEIELTVADVDVSKAREIAAHYGAEVLENLNDDAALNAFDLIGLCVSTPFHASYLERLRNLPRKPFVLCEKPVVGSLEEIASLKEDVAFGDRILVNYIRRFQPGFLRLKTQLEDLLKQPSEKVRHIVIRYSRGLLNNGSHALDLVSFLLGCAPEITDVQVLQYAFDAFPTDPTASLQCRFGGIPVTMIGFEQPCFTIFEIDLYTTTHHIAIRESGDVVRYFRANAENGSKLIEEENLQQQGIMKDYMIPVLETTLQTMQNAEPTNFKSALLLNETLLQTIAQINLHHGKTGS